jgi:YVTN family beta-propeller protein
MKSAARVSGRVVLIAMTGVWGVACTPGAPPGDSTPREATIWATGRRVTPAGALVELAGDMPLRIAAASDGKSMLVVTGGFHDHSIDVIDPDDATLHQRILLGKAWAGLAVDGARDAIYVSGGGPITDDMRNDSEVAALDPKVRASLERPIIHLSWHPQGLTVEEPLTIPNLAEKDRFIAGLVTDAHGHLFAINFQTDSLYELDAATDRVLASTRLGYRPFQLAISPDGANLAVANWGEQSVSLVSTSTLKESARIPVGMHPTDLGFAHDGRLFVANAGSNSISVIRDGAVSETILTSLRPDDPVGSTPNGLAVNADGSRLYVANADNNDVAVVDVHEPGHSRVLGFIPTGWYPTSLALTPDGRHLVVGVAKGIDSRANWPARDPKHAITDLSNKPFDYIGRVMSGYAEIIPTPDVQQLAKYTQQVRDNLPVADHQITQAERDSALAAFKNIKHVVYIIRENRTYDQVLGDDPRGDGVKDLAFVGQALTPNVHALVQQTPLLDRYFLNGEVSEDGHYWANSAYATAYNERATGTMYAGRGIPGLHDLDADQRVIESPAGYLWEVVKRAGLTYFNYGEFGDKAGQSPLFTNDHDIERHSSRDWGFFFGKSDVDRAAIFARDLKAAERRGQWPNFMVMSLPWDHTYGLAPGKPTPQAMMAANDLALGKMVEAVSHSSFWASTAIFVTEDDAQDGPDHVDDHRSVGLVISPYVKAGFVDHTPYTMTSMVRTIEVILHLPPMTQHDRDATPMYRLFQAKPTLWTYAAQPETVDLKGVNPASGPLADASSRLDFSAPDRADPQTLNAILWSALKPGRSMPAPVRSASAGLANPDDDP